MRDSIKDFTELTVWQRGHALVLEIYRFTKQFPSSETYGLTSQLRRAAVSVTANISEGFERYHYLDKIRFYHQSRGSLAEIHNVLILAKDLNLLDSKICDVAAQEVIEVRKLLNGLIRSQRISYEN